MKYDRLLEGDFDGVLQAMERRCVTDEECRRKFMGAALRSQVRSSAGKKKTGAAREMARTNALLARASRISRMLDRHFGDGEAGREYTTGLKTTYRAIRPCGEAWEVHGHDRKGVLVCTFLWYPKHPEKSIFIQEVQENED